MICFPNAKINLGLNIVEKRSDGFHNIETVFYPINWCDAIEVIENKEFQKGDEKTNLSLSGIVVEGNTQDNLIVKAYKLLDAVHNLPPIKTHLHKVIPMGAGLGGGSSDAAFFIKLLNNKFSLNLPATEQLNFAKQLGSDCAFFIENKPVYASGKGDVFTEVEIDLSQYCIVIVYPAVHSNTALAYKGVVLVKPQKNIQLIIASDIKNWKEDLVNDFEKTIFLQHPELQNIKNTFYSKGALYASMSGSGSAVYSILKNDVDIKEFSFPNNYLIWKSK
ncbi:MAG TPA: 4-(cytidine 5'-diphospho)-2-C-methyl-D-erythritol kinase [Bacteroidia bacterium]|jgi:4-diphosphocytidyl-2-C-methyl-D-erythritol kinase|nr:4-(cytidine 5'-diphospho)-2-C-methyl-D-erythritol kinase [Bacteroidia bacterium]